VCDFDLSVLSRQIGKECLSPDTHKGTFGVHQSNLLTYNSTLIMRIETLLKSSDMTCFFSDNGRDICDEIDLFLDDPNANAMVLSFEHVSFKHDARALLLNALGRHLLTMARKGCFRSRPLVCFLDDAHQFIGRSVGDEANSVNLDAFGLIAKEGRKYGLTTTIATQRPRDVPQDVLSQLGTLFVHRLTNDRDRDMIVSACGDLDKSAAAFIPSLSQGEVILVGPDLPAPLPLMMKPPAKSQQPTSSGPQFQKGWGQHVVE
jgi:DNA helicase HerA-like ATPase